MFAYLFELAGWLTDWVAEWLTDPLTNWPSNPLTSWLNEWPNDWWTDWMNDGRTVWLSHWLTDLMTDWIAEWLTDWLTYDWLTDWIIDWINDKMNDSLTDWLTEWVIDWLTEWLSDWQEWLSTDWMIAWLIQWLTRRNEWYTEGVYIFSCLSSLFLQNLGRRQSTNHWRLFWPWSLAQWFNFSTHSYCRLLASRLDTSAKSFIISHLNPIFTHFLRLAHEDLPQSQWGTVYKGLWGTKMNTLTLWLPLVTKKGFLLTLSRQCQADKWQE